jgi:hypothetical protein
MRNAHLADHAHRRSPVFRLRPLPVRPPLGQRAYLAHGDASLPQLLVRSGDVLCVSTDQAEDGLEVFEPRSPGHPMLGQRAGAELRSLPANLPCSGSLWASVGAVAAIWRRGFASQPSTPASASQPSAAVRRALCVRLPQPALALARAEHPHLMGAQLQASPQEGGSVLVFPGRDLDAAPVAQASARELSALAEQLAALLGPGSRVVEASADQIVVTAWRELSLPMATLLARSMARQLRLPISVVAAQGLEQAQLLAGGLGPDQLLWLVPPPARPAVVAAAPRPVAHRRPALVPAPVPPELPRASASAWPSPPAISDGKPASQPGAVQLGLFDRAEAA